MNKAATLEKSIFLFNPIKPLSTPEELRDFYVEMRELLERLALLVYGNGGFWCDVHLVLKAEVQERAARRAIVA
jgi:hypothetical protein